MFKRFFFFIVFQVVFLLFIHSQVVVTSPEFPTPEQAVTIYFDAALGDKGLQGYTGDVYAHTGLVTENSTSATDWKYVKTNWGQNTTDTKLTRISNDYYKLEITPDVFSYYNCPISEKILKLAFVFRSSDANLTGRNADGSDILINVFDDYYGITIAEPDTNQIFQIGENIEINAIALFANNISVYLNDTLLTDTSSNQVSINHVLTKANNNKLVIIASNEDTIVKDSTTLFVIGNPNIEELPSTNLMDGINYIDSSTITLVLYAPNKNFVYLKSSHNNYKLTSQNILNKTTDSLRYWITLDSLTPNTEYIYQYVIDGEITIADPYCEKILDPWNDSHIDENTYPNLIEYPYSYLTGIASVFNTGEQNYFWQNQQFNKPQKEDLVIYELLIRDFVAQHNYNTLIDTLSYLKTLGINAIELMPVSEFEGNSSWGYNPSFYFVSDKYYGTKNKLKEFIDVCHSNGIAVIMDIVLNHSYGQSPLVQMYFENGNPSSENPWYNVQSPNTAYSWGYDFNHQSPETQKFVSRVVKFWLEEYRFDGFRFDFTKGFTNTPGDGYAYDYSRINILSRIADTIKAYSPDAYIILEHFAENSEEKALASKGMMLWGNHNHNYCQSSMGYTQESNFWWISYKNRGWNSPNLVGYMESHDEERQMYKNITWGNSFGSYDIKDPQIALKRAELTALFFFTIPGPKMIWQFEELGYDISIDYDCRVCEKPILWEYYNDEYRNRLYHFYSHLIKAKQNHQLFKSQDFSIDAGNNIKTILLNDSLSKGIIIGNFDVTSDSATLDFSGSETWFEYFSGDTLKSTDNKIFLQAGEYRFFTNFKMDKPNIPSFPEAINVTIKGNPNIGNTLEGSYRYIDMNNDKENLSEYRWYRCNDESGSELELIAEATGKNYQVKQDDLNKYLMFEVTPIAESSTFKKGISAQSKIVGPVTMLSSEIIIIPNPVNDKVILKGISDYESIEIHNAMGKKIFEYNTNHAFELCIDLFELENGLHIITFRGNGVSKSRKIIKL